MSGKNATLLKHQGFAGVITCLRCNEEFQSVNKRSNRICCNCKRTQEWSEPPKGEALYMLPGGLPKKRKTKTINKSHS